MGHTGSVALQPPFAGGASRACISCLFISFHIHAARPSHRKRLPTPSFGQHCSTRRCRERPLVDNKRAIVLLRTIGDVAPLRLLHRTAVAVHGRPAPASVCVSFFFLLLAPVPPSRRARAGALSLHRSGALSLSPVKLCVCTTSPTPSPSTTITKTLSSVNRRLSYLYTHAQASTLMHAHPPLQSRAWVSIYHISYML